MTEREALEQKSFSDLVEIAVAFNLISRDDASKKTSGELVALIAGDPVKEEAPKKKRTTKKAATKETSKESSASETEEKVIEEPAPKKAKTSTRKPKAKTTKEETVKEDIPEVKEAVEQVKEETAEKKETPKKKSRSKKETKDAKSDVVETSVQEEVVKTPEATETPANEVVAEIAPFVEEKVSEPKNTNKKTKKPASKSKAKKSAEVNADVPTTEETKAPITSETNPVEVTPETTEVAEVTEAPNKETDKSDKAEGKKVSKRNRRNSKSKKNSDNKEEVKPEVAATESEDKTSETSEEAPKAEEKPAEEGSKKKQKKPVRGRKRTLSFGTQENGEVVVTEIESKEITEGEATEEKAPEVPEVVEPEIQYIEVEGVLSIGSGDKGDFNGFIHKNNYLPGDEDAFVQGQLIRRMGLRRGDYIKGLAVPPKGKEKYAPLKRILSVNGIELTEDMDMDVIRKRKRFETLTAIYPDEKLVLETDFGKGKNDISTRIIDLFSPIGKGQRGMIVSPPKAGKTVLLKKVANAIKANNPSCHLIVLLIDERPEEVTDMQRSINGEVVYSTFDKKPENHVRVTELVLERAMRLVEIGQDVVILLDSMTRLARAYNLTINPTGRTLSGGLDPGSLYGPKRFFGAARNIENGGSLTIIATALIETGSRMDEVIFEEFKGTGNMEVTLDRKLADRRVFPAIAVDKSGTRREDLLLTPEELEAIWLLRKKIADVDTTTATDAVINFMQKTTNNSSFVLSIKKSFAVDD